MPKNIFKVVSLLVSFGFFISSTYATPSCSLPDSLKNSIDTFFTPYEGRFHGLSIAQVNNKVNAIIPIIRGLRNLERFSDPTSSCIIDTLESRFLSLTERTSSQSGTGATNYKDALKCLDFSGDIAGPLYYADPNKSYKNTYPDGTSSNFKSPLAEMVGLWITNFTRGVFILDEKNFETGSKVIVDSFQIGGGIGDPRTPAYGLPGFVFETNLYECVDGKRYLVRKGGMVEVGIINFIIGNQDSITKMVADNYSKNKASPKTIEDLERTYFTKWKPNTLYIIEYGTYNHLGRIERGLVYDRGIIVKDIKKELGVTSLPAKTGNSVVSPVDCFKDDKGYALPDGYSQSLYFKDSTGSCKAGTFRCEKGYIRKGQYYIGNKTPGFPSPSSPSSFDALASGSELYSRDCSAPKAKLDSYYGTPRNPKNQSSSSSSTTAQNPPGWKFTKTSSAGYADFSPMPPNCTSSQTEGTSCNAGSVCLSSGGSSALVCTNVSGAKLGVTYSKTTMKSTGDSITITVSGLGANNFQGCRAVLAHPVSSNVNPYKCDNSPQFSTITSGTRSDSWKYENGTWKITVLSDPSSLPAGTKLRSSYKNKDTGEVKSIEWEVAN